MPKISFSHNWNNKLDCDIFTTIRSYNDNKYEYYHGLIGKRLNVFLKGQKHCEVILENTTHLLLDECTETLLILDTGTFDYGKIFSNFGLKDDSRVIVLTFKRVKKSNE